MYQIIAGNMFQNHMCAKFNMDVTMATSTQANVRGKEKLVYEYMNNLYSCFQPAPLSFDVNGNPHRLYADYATFKKDFVRYWRRALDKTRADESEIEGIFDDAITTQEQCRKRNTTYVFFEDGKALTIDDCLRAIYDVLELA